MNRDQLRARSAYERVSKVQEGQKAKYGVIALKLPFLIRSSGLAQALAFAGEKAEGDKHTLLADLAATVSAALGETVSASELLRRSRAEADATSYLLLTREVLLAATWYKRLAASVLQADATAEA